MPIISKFKRFLVVGIFLAGSVALSGCGVQEPPSSTLTPEVTEYVMHADFPFYESAPAMVARSTSVVTGRIIDSQVRIIDIFNPSQSEDERLNPQAGKQIGAAVSGEEVFTVHLIKVDTVIKGQPVDTLEVKVLGGEVEGVKYVLDGAPELTDKADKELLFFLEEYEDGTPSSPLNNDQAIFVVDAQSRSVEPLGNGELPRGFLEDVQALVFDG